MYEIDIICLYDIYIYEIQIPQVLAIYQATFDRDFPTGGMQLVCETLGLDTAKYPGDSVRHYIR